MREGDIYKWKWKPELGRNDWGAFGSYHCKSRTAIVHDGCLLDTYWMNFGSSFKQQGWAESRAGAHSVCFDTVDLTLIANLEDLEEIHHGEEAYYARQAIVDLRHENCSSAPIYKRKGTQRCAAVMARLLNDKIEGCENQIRSAERDLQTYQKQLDDVSSGDTTIYII